MSDRNNLQKALNFSSKQNENSIKWIEELKKDKEDSVLTKIIFAYLNIIIEHHKSIIELTNIRQSSALCLIRPLFEAHIRVMWLTTFENTHKILKPIKKIHELNDNNSFPSLEKMCQEIDEELSRVQKIDNPNIMTKDLNNNKKLMHSYTHGGGFLLSIQLNKKDVFTYQDMIDVLDSVSNYLLNSMIALSQNKKNINVSLKIFKESEKWY